MPRQAKKKSNTEIYHVMARGINRQVIFEDEDDYIKFIDTLKTYKAVCGYKLYAYCLMGNHFHLLVKAELEDLGQIIKRVLCSYVYWYNSKYQRIGHLFQDRYKSEVVEDERYFLVVMRYILRNPVKAGICNKIGEYRFSSYNYYLKENSGFVDTDYINSIINKEEFLLFINENSDDDCLECDNRDKRLGDSEAMETIQKVSGCNNITEFQSLGNEQREEYIKMLRKKGMSIRQISRLTGISNRIVRIQ